MRVIVCRKAHAAWVDNELSLSGANGARNMCVAAGNKWRTLSPKSEFYFFRAGGPDTADLYCFQKVRRIAGRRAMAQKHFRCQRNARRKRLEPGKLFGSELGMGVFIRRTSALRTMVEDLPLMVSRQAPPALRHDVLRGLKWQQRPRHTVTQVHDLVHTTMPEVTRNRFQGCKVSVNVGDKCDAHVPF